MFRKNNYIFSLTLLLFYVIEIWLVKSKQFQVGIILYFLYGLFLYFVNEKYIISFFVFNLPLLPIITTDYKILSFIGPHEIIYGFSLLILSKSNKNYKTNLNKYQELSIKFIYFLFFIHIFIIIKDILFGLKSDDTKGFLYVFKVFFRFYLYYTSLVLLIKVIYKKGILEYVFIGIKYVIVTIPISMIFTKTLILMGAGIKFAESRKDRILTSDYERFVGFYGAGGDENSAGIFFVGFLGFLLALYEKTGGVKKYFVFMGFAIFGTLLTGSRTAFMALILVILIFLLTRKKGSIKISIIIIGIVFYFTFFNQIDMVIQRFFDPSAVVAIDPNEMGRVGKWNYYISWIFNNPITLVIGNQENISLSMAPHNYFIFLLYHTGIIPLLIFLNLLVRLVKLIKFKVSPEILRNIYYVLPFFFILMTVNSFGSSIFLWLYLPIGAKKIINI